MHASLKVWGLPLKKLESVLQGRLGWVSLKLCIMAEQRIFDSFSLSASGKLPSTVGIQCSSEYSKTSLSGHSEKRTHSLQRTMWQSRIENPVYVIH